ncbi:uncharacterized protein LOC135116393 [Scylla paramamosain]|uniref:uncharacterized protein LOC135116393 n=1 Tax=Scylla paramamosain TaxID=85552 RepID=UPI0030838363
MAHLGPNSKLLCAANQAASGAGLHLSNTPPSLPCDASCLCCCVCGKKSHTLLGVQLDLFLTDAKRKVKLNNILDKLEKPTMSDESEVSDEDEPSGMVKQTEVHDLYIIPANDGAVTVKILAKKKAWISLIFLQHN